MCRVGGFTRSLCLIFACLCVCEANRLGTHEDQSTPRKRERPLKSEFAFSQSSGGSQLFLPSYLNFQMWANPPEVEFQTTLSQSRTRNKISSLLVYVLHKTRYYRHFPIRRVQKRQR